MREGTTHAGVKKWLINTLWDLLVTNIGKCSGLNDMYSFPDEKKGVFVWRGQDDDVCTSLQREKEKAVTVVHTVLTGNTAI